MKICPVCKTQYEDSILACPKDDSTLLPLPEAPPNPELIPVLHAEPDAVTSEIDWEAVQSEFKKLHQEKEVQHPPRWDLGSAEEAEPWQTQKDSGRSLLWWLIGAGVVVVLGGLAFLYFYKGKFW